MRSEVVYLIVVLAAVAAVVAYSGIPHYNFTGTYNVTGTAKPPPVETSPPSLTHINATSEEVPPFFPSSLLFYPTETESPTALPSVTTTPSPTITPSPTPTPVPSPTATKPPVTEVTITPSPTITVTSTSVTTTATVTTTEASTTTTKTTTTATAATTTETTTLPKPTLEGPLWRKNSGWEGSGTRNTEQFTVTSPNWRINWTAWEWRRDGVFYLMLYGDGESKAQLIVQHQGPGTGTYPLNTTGTYYLKIQSNEFWKIDVEEETNGTITETPAPPAYREVQSWSGVSGKNLTKISTEKFEISNSTWRITWTTKGNGALQIRVYDEGDRWFDISASIWSDHGASYIYSGPGKFSLLIESVNLEWEVAAEEPV